MSESLIGKTLPEFISRFQLQLPQPGCFSANSRHAAVLIPIICRPEPTLLLTRRSNHLRKHAGQVAFPGGKADPDDHSLIATALREAEEEVAIPASAVHVLGQLAPLDSSSGYQVTPIVGLVPDTVAFHGNEDEVAGLFEMPLYEALSLSRYYSLDIHRGGINHRVYLSWYERQFVWGLTAAIIRRLAQQVSP
ncbi:CoA pyrophosphatase [Yersinia massiliensis]|uniref:CoA pyrophosphatase n=1 Tax=Yersinia TaxID=629 RepID=UPI0005E9CE8B|nr:MULTISPECIES: CoA pyrophosphatase [Yersinia]HEC1651787.1 CoA pyrophosphatase [Yersinia enterocolitica]MDA5550128.1 CoA pyrophosphatase [Yersinia massiliensis]UZM80858.1 CoA pyrophosphatase [Yersinia massiliensis]CFR20108.1 nudix hydrolase YeaB [Yersinia frederiksenii]CNF53235.1 nudix hydrolase YeaB [Yersinia frederiksenii]